MQCAAQHGWELVIRLKRDWPDLYRPSAVRLFALRAPDLALTARFTELEQKPGSARFFRIHRGTLLNLDWLDELTPWFTGRMAARLKDEKRTEWTAARDRVGVLKPRLGI